MAEVCQRSWLVQPGILKLPWVYQYIQLTKDYMMFMKLQYPIFKSYPIPAMNL
jgi:hypothetical protein